MCGLITAMTTAITSALATTIGSTAITVGGALAATAVAATAVAGGVTAYKSARASAKAQKAQEEALSKLVDNTGTTGVSDTVSTLEDNTTTKRTLSSLRISLLPQADTDTASEYLDTIDSNSITDSTSNMTGLNIAAA